MRPRTLRRAAAILAVFAGPVLYVTYGTDYAGGALTLMFVAIGLWPFLVNSARKVSLYAAGRERDAVRWSALSLGVQVVACVSLIPRFGAAGQLLHHVLLDGGDGIAALQLVAHLEGGFQLGAHGFLQRGDVAQRTLVIEVLLDGYQLAAEQPLDGFPLFALR